MGLKPKLGVGRDGSYAFTAPVSLESIRPWVPTMARFRDAVFKRHITGMDLQDDVSSLYAPRQHEVEAINQSVLDAVTAGRVIDFGYIPNEVLKEGGQRGGLLYTDGHIGMPFRDPWVLWHTWDAATVIGELDKLRSLTDRQPSVYLIQLMELDKPAGGAFEAVELEPVALNADDHSLMIGDRILCDHFPEDGDDDRMHAKCTPSPWRVKAFLSGMMRGIDLETMIRQGAGNVLDPIMTALLILATDGIDRRTEPAPEKLNRHRVKAGKFPIPGYDVVDTMPYITALQAKRTPRRKGEPLGGHHASPIMHLRRGHNRTYETGRQTWIRDSLVNATEEAKANLLRRRAGYQVRP
jgi:hypothetical protein